MHQIKSWVRAFLNSLKLLAGLIFYSFQKTTPAFAYQGMVGLFCFTGGKSNDLLSSVLTFRDQKFLFKDSDGVLGNMNNEENLNKAVTSLKEKGFYIFPNRLSKDLCDRLLQFGLSHPSKIRSMDKQVGFRSVEVIYDRNQSQAVRYDFDAQALLRNEDIQLILADMSFAALAQEYLGSRPIIDVLSLWWHTDYSKVPDSEAAQFFHFDLDRPKWLKFFIYLTDVGPQNGPHSFVEGSHKTNAIPSSLLSKGYARLTDEEVKGIYDSSRIKEFCAPCGTIIAEDTRGLHKGKHVEDGDRLVLQIQYSNSLFGGDYPKFHIEEKRIPELKKSMTEYPELYSAYS